MIKGSRAGFLVQREEGLAFEIQSHCEEQEKWRQEEEF